jgi:hypothetical protein
LILVVVAARVVLALAVIGVVLGIGFVFLIGALGDHVLELRDGTWVVATEVFEGATVAEIVLEAVDDFFVSDVDYGRALVKKVRMHWRSVSPCFFLTISRSM